MEYLLVQFPDVRNVSVDDVVQGSTGEILQLEKGTHIVSLQAPPQNFSPQQKKIILAGTSVLAPREVTFEKI